MSKEKLDAYLKAKQADGKKLFIPYIVAGEDGFDALKDQILFLQECGVSAIELGIPFSDPVADGPTIQQAGLRALNRGISLGKVLDFLGDFPERNVPIILMTYLNPVYAYGIERFAEKCAEVGVSGVIIPDVPMEEESLIAGSLKTHSIAFIRLVALTSTEDRMIELAKRSEGFLYAVSVTGTTGARAEHQDNVYAYLDKL